MDSASQDSSLGNYAPSIMKMAKAQRMDSGIKMDIFCTMMSAEVKASIKYY